MLETVYQNLINLVQHNASSKIQFELPSCVHYSIFDYPASVLLKITDNEEFIKQVYLKLLDRGVEEPTLLTLKNKLDKSKITKQDVLKIIMDSEESKIKHTKLNWNK